jgi:hypothetical protein
MITETDVNILKSRIAKGLTYCNELLGRRNLADGEEFEKLDDQLDVQSGRLIELNEMLTLQGFNDCCFGPGCKFSDDFQCFVCTRGS